MPFAQLSTSAAAGDGQELYAINTQYGKAPGRNGPVLIGSVKSNMGHCEGASCLAGAHPLDVSACQCLQDICCDGCTAASRQWPFCPLQLCWCLCWRCSRAH